VFEDPRTLGARVKSNKAQAKPRAQEAAILEAMYDADELDD